MKIRNTVTTIVYLLLVFFVVDSNAQRFGGVRPVGPPPGGFLTPIVPTSGNLGGANLNGWNTVGVKPVAGYPVGTYQGGSYPTGGNPGGGIPAGADPASDDPKPDDSGGPPPPPPRVYIPFILGAMLGDSDLDEEAEVLYGLYENLVLNHLMDPVLDDLEKKTRANGIVIVTIPNHSLLLTNREVIKIILQMETTMIHDVEKKLLDDLKAIRPFINESPVQKEIKLAAVKRDEKYVRDVTAAAIQEANAGTTWKPTEPTVQTSNDSQSSSDSGSGSDSASGSDRSISYQREPTEALRQLMHVNVKGWGSN